MGSYNDYEKKKNRLREEKEAAKGLHCRWAEGEAGERHWSRELVCRVGHVTLYGRMFRTTGRSAGARGWCPREGFRNSCLESEPGHQSHIPKP